jgi:drug/metabolite transporter (DMT)-like permease
VPGAFFGLNLAVFFAGATHNSVANAALIGSLAPFLIVPVGAWLFAEYIDPRALVFAVLAFGGVALVLFSAPPNGDASLEGNVFGFLAMLLLVAYVAATRHYRRGMDVTTFMATICPIATVAVLPLALAHGDVFGMSGTGWTYTLILTLTSGVAAQGLLVYAQKRSRSARSRSPRSRSRRSRSCGPTCCWPRSSTRARRSASRSSWVACWRSCC